MNARERFQRAEQTFRSAVAMPHEERAAFVAHACAGETTLREEVEGMLRADACAEGALDAPAVAWPHAVADLLPSPAPEREADAIPARIGGYEIVRLLGAGGMGVVYEARQESPNRSVALKVMRTAGMSAQAVRRFRREAEVLGRLQDPGIAQIYEASVADWGEGPQPYFSMELVLGAPLLAWSRRPHIGVREQIALLARLCDAVQSAHQKGVVHRDLKPANILVVDSARSSHASPPTTSGESGSVEAGEPQPKILDFGIARTMEPDGQVATLHTGVGQLIGTVPYMSPEQAAGDRSGVDTRSDVYSLGVIAFELLSGRLPHEVCGKPLPEALRIIGTSDAPRLGSIDRTLRGDLTAIVGKALERSVSRRYASAGELGADFRRFLRHEPILARRSGALDRIVKFARRNRGLVATGVVAVIGLIATTAVSLRLATLAESARAEERRLRSVAVDRAVDAERAAYRSALAAASSALRFHEVSDARRHLESAPVALRGWEWEHLWSRLDDSVALVTSGSRGAAHVGISPDGRSLIAAAPNGELDVWRVGDVLACGSAALSDHRRGKIEGSWRGRWVTGIAGVTNESCRMGTRGGDVIIDLASLSTLQLAAREEETLSIGDDGWMAWWFKPGAGPRALRLSRGEGPPLDVDGDLKLPDDASASFGPGGELVAIGGGGSFGLAVIDTKSGRTLLRRDDVAVSGPMCFSAGGLALAVALEGTDAIILALDGTGRDRAIRGHAAPIRAMAFRSDDQTLATASDDGTVRLWDASIGSCSAVMRGNAAPVRSIAFASDGTLLVTGCVDGTIRLWSAVERSDPFVLPVSGPAYSVAFTPDGSRFASGSLGGDRPVRLWDRTSGTLIDGFGDGHVSALAFDRAGSRLAIGRSHGPTTIVSLPDDASVAVPIRSLSGHWWRTDWMTFLPQGRLASIGNGGLLTVDTLAAEGAASQPRRSLRLERHSLDVGFRGAHSPDGRTIAATAHEHVLLLDAESLEERGRFVGQRGRIYALAFSPDGRRLVTGGAGRVIVVWDVATQTMEAKLVAHTDTIYALAFSPDGTRIVSGGADRLVRIWDAETFEELVRLQGHEAYVYSLAFSPDGSALLSGGGDATVRVWDTTPFRELVAARSAHR